MRCLFLVYVCFATFYSSNGVENPEPYAPDTDALIQRLKLEKWDAEETPCLENSLAILENVKNFTLWATWVWNANSLPAGNLYGSWVHFGNFDQCMNPPWLRSHPQFKTQYCLADLILSDRPKKMAVIDPYSSTEDYLDSPTKSGLPVNRVQWGVCMPVSCRPHSIAKIAKVLYQRTNFGKVGPNVSVDHCQVAGEQQQYGTGFYLFIALIASLFTMAIASTFYENITSAHQKPFSKQSFITKSFCMVKNHQDLMKENKDEIKMMNGMRFITALAVVLIHEQFFMMIAGIINTRNYEEDVAGLLGTFLHLDIVVDTFFAMSGLLHIKGLLAGRQKNLFLVLWKRYIRLIGPFALSIFYLISVSKYTGSGPFWSKGSEFETGVCLKTWPLSLLMLNSSQKYLCNVVTWYISCDYQLAILGTVLFYFYQKNKRFGITTYGIIVVFSMIIPGVLTYWYQLPVVHYMDLGKILQYTRNYWELGYTYKPFYSRAGSYLIGVALGFLMTAYKPTDYRKTISKTWSVIGTGTSLTVMICVLALGRFYLEGEYHPLEAAITAATNRVVWAVAVCCFIGLCEYGSVPLVSDILGLPFFTPLSRLSYGIYVVHPLIIQRNKFSLRSPLKYDKFSMFTDTIGTLTVSVGLSYIMWLLVEAPVINLCNHLMFTKSKASETKAN